MVGMNKKQTLADEIDVYTNTLKELASLRDKALQNHRMLKDDMYLNEYKLYGQGIHTAQLVLVTLLKKAETRA